MTRILETADAFVEDALEGFARVHRGEVRRVDGGIVRAGALDAGCVAVVIGGGSGHYPAFAGLVGPGLAAAAVCGNIFASPSAGQAERVALAAHAGGGVLFSYGNYAGDVLHFGEAERRLRAAGIDVRTVLVTDDLASAPPETTELRRGIAGDLCVFRIAGAAAESGRDLDAVEALARRANARTRSLGVAFAGCTLPGAAEPLFTVPAGTMSVGLGIHGEAGIRDAALPSARELARTLAGPLLDERPDGADDRVVLLVNGLGSVKYEELFVLYRYLSELLEEAGLTIVEPECGELVTSLDMAGVSATLLWLDAELEELWRSPVSTPAYRKGAVAARPAASPRPSAVAVAAPAAVPSAGASAASRTAAGTAHALLVAARGAVSVAEHRLGQLDAFAGDGDHGIGMLRGLHAALAAFEPELGVEAALGAAGEAWSERAGGTSGALWGAALAAVGSTLGDRDAYPPAAVATALRAGADRVAELGGATLGDKTILDALLPFLDELDRGLAAGTDPLAALSGAADAATAAADGTASLTPRLGRARPLAERSLGHPDPGAVSFAIIAVACATALSPAAPSDQDAKETT